MNDDADKKDTSSGSSTGANNVDSDRTIFAPSNNGPSQEQGAGPATQDNSAADASVLPVTNNIASVQKTLQPGTVINNMYRVEDPLGEGGMGRVYRGIELATQKKVAIKVILPEMADTQQVTNMFRKEAATLSDLHHQAIVRYLAYVPPSTELQVHALIMGFIEGQKLSDFIRQRGPLSTMDVCKLFSRLADGLAAAHEIGVVHRDLSPDNVMLPDNKVSKAVLIDFGIAKSEMREVTLGGEFAGKLKYVSPEQLGSYDGVTNPQSDIYSLALLMITALTGKPAFAVSSIVEAVEARKTVPDLSGVPAEFQGILHSMLQPDPAIREGSMEKVRTALSDIAKGKTLGYETSWQRTSPLPVEANTVAGLQTPTLGISGGITPQSSQNRTLDSDQASTAGQEDDDTKTRSSSLFVATAVLALLTLGLVVWMNPHLTANYFPQGGVSDQIEEADGPPGLKRNTDTREGFLATLMSDECAFISLRQFGSSAGQLQAMKLASIDVKGAVSKWSNRFGDVPFMESSNIDLQQCAAVALAKKFQGTQAGRIEIALTDTLKEGIAGSVYGSSSRAVWLGIITPTGNVFSLSRRLNDPIGNERKFGFQMPAAPDGTYVMIALASEKALVRTGAMKDGVKADALLPLISREMENDQESAVDIIVLEF